VQSSTSYDELAREGLISALIERDREVEKLHHLLLQAKKAQYGRKSEKLSSSNQEELFTFSPEPESPLESAVEAPSITEVAGHSRKARVKRKIPEWIERERIEYDLDCATCSGCAQPMPVIGEEISEELEFIPATFKLIQHARLKRACPGCKNGVFVAKLPPEVKPLERCMAGAGLLAQISISKYEDHNPLYRQEQIFKRHGIELPRRLLCGWVAGAVDLLMPLYETMKKELLSESYLQGDETTLKVQDGETKGKLHTGYLWAMLGPPNKVLFHYAESRAGAVPLALFKDFRGRLQTDAYAGYNPVLIPEQCERIACMAHIRRKFIEAQATAKQDAQKVLQVIAELYKLERTLKGRLPEERLERRKRRAFPLLRKLYRLIRQQRKRTLPQSVYAKALSYAWDQRIPMLRYLRDGRYEIDNNLIENQMRPVALGRKNYLFAGSHEGARRAAVLYTFINSCRLNKINAFEYLRDVFTRIHTPGVHVQELLPHNWQPSRS